MKKYYLSALLFAILFFIILFVLSIGKNTADTVWRSFGNENKDKKRIEKEIQINNANKIQNQRKNNGKNDFFNKSENRLKKKYQNKKYFALILDDAGLLPRTYGLIKLKKSINFSILPCQAYSNMWLNKLKKNKRHEILIHIPMAAYNNAASGLKPGMTLNQISKLFENWYSIIKYSKGANNHQGSLATGDTKLMRKFFKIFREYGLYFIDSLTTHKSKAYYFAKKNNIDTLKRNYFIDNEKSVAYISKMLKHALRHCVKYGYAVAIAHTTTKNLSKVLKKFEKHFTRNNVVFVKVSELFKILRFKKLNS